VFPASLPSVKAPLVPFKQEAGWTKKLNSVALVRERTIPTGRPPLVGEVSANFWGIEDVAWSAQRIPTVVNLVFLDRSRYFFLPSSSEVVLTRLSGPCSRPTASHKICKRRESNPGPGRYVEDNLLPLLDRLARSTVTIPTEPSQLQ
jgi:hypothetical protein